MAGNLPIAPIRWVAPQIFEIARLAGIGFFLILATFAVRVVGRATIAQAPGTVLTSGTIAVGGFRRQLEASKLNPRDADAHYQLGLIH
ncbi:MAG: hypothetical protein ABI995_06405 [Acidobacteriota bacterium]